jgi:hypothetical protein
MSSETRLYVSVGDSSWPARPLSLWPTSLTRPRPAGSGQWKAHRSLGLGIAAGKVALIGSYHRASCLVRGQRGDDGDGEFNGVERRGLLRAPAPSARNLCFLVEAQAHERTRSRMTTVRANLSNPAGSTRIRSPIIGGCKAAQASS